MEGHHKNKCPYFRDYFYTGALNPLVPEGVYCEICRIVRHHPTACPLMQKYQSTTKNLFCNFCKSMGHDKKECCTLNLMRERITEAYKVQGEEGPEGGVPQYNT
jgi:hypothetical protein